MLTLKSRNSHKLQQAFDSMPVCLPTQLRHHPLPKEEQFSNLMSCAAARGFNINTTTNKLLADSLNQCVDTSDPIVNKVNMQHFS